MEESTKNEMLTVSRKKIQEVYIQNNEEINRENGSSSDKDCYEYANEVLKTLFGSKCQLDEKEFAENANCKEPKAAEPRFEVGDMVIYKRTGKKKVVFGTDKYGRYCVTLPNMQSPMYVDESDLEPYTEPKEDHIVVNNEMVKDFDTILKDSFSKERRLTIAAMAMQGMLSNTTRFSSYEISDLVRISLNCADALIAEQRKEVYNE